MGSGLLIAQEYFSPVADGPWRWSGDGEALVWGDGTTLAFRAEIEGILRHFGPIGLPPFDAIALLLAACRLKPDVLPYEAFAADEWMEHDKEIAGRCDDLGAALAQIAALPAEIRTSPEAKPKLLAAVLDGTIPGVRRFMMDPRKAAALLKEVDEGLIYSLLPTAPPSRRLERWGSAISSLWHGLHAFDPASLEWRDRTGLDRGVLPAPLDIPTFVVVRGLLDELARDREWSALSRLARNLMAAVHIPRTIDAADDLPLGGVSDISHRGPLDRLLVSELANDDFTLAVRVAMNEAMYLRREHPPHTPHGRRAILVDAGIRMWGVSRVFATAVALALAATADRHAQVLVFRAADAGLEPIDLSTKRGLLAHLGALDTAPHPGGSLAAFLEEAVRQTGPRDHIIVTHVQALSDREFQKCIPARSEPLYCAGITAQGTFELHAFTKHGRSVLREATLDLEQLLEPRRGETSVTRRRVRAGDESIPHILRVEPFPLLLPSSLELRSACAHPEWGTVAATSDGRLLQWTDPARGGRQITSRLPRAPRRFISVGDDGVVCMLCGTRNPMLVRAGMDGGEILCVPLKLTPQRGPTAVVENGGMLLVIGIERIDAIDPGDGRTVRSAAWPVAVKGIQPWPCAGRIAPTQIGWTAAGWDGTHICFADVARPDDESILLALFERRGRDGIWCITKKGQIFDVTSGEAFGARLAANGLLNIHGISRDGNRIMAWSPSTHGAGRRILIIDLAAGSVTSRYSPNAGFLEPEIQRFHQQRTLQRRFQGIGIDEQRRLLIRGPHYAYRVVLAEPPALALQSIVHESNTEREFAPFGQMSIAASSRHQGTVGPAGMRVADLGGGHRAFLDRRGLIHLKSANPEIAETTLIMTVDSRSASQQRGARHLSAWCSDGISCGETFFFEESPSESSPSEVYDRIMLFTRQLS